jgi:hypothetical protein
MDYPTISYDQARAWWRAWEAAGEPGDSPDAVENTSGFHWYWGTEATTLANDLLDLLERSREAGGRDRCARFEAEAAVRIHRTLPRDHLALADPEFWIWYAVDPGLSVVRARYSGNTIPGMANFASPNARESLFYRLWVRGEMGWRAVWGHRLLAEPCLPTEVRRVPGTTGGLCPFPVSGRTGGAASHPADEQPTQVTCVR